MKTAIISFTREGARLCARLVKYLSQDADCECSGFVMPKWAAEYELRECTLSVQAWTAEAFRSCDTIIFIGSADTAARSIAPCVRDRKTDPAVLVIDNSGQYVIPLLSGKASGANDISVRLAKFIGAVPVITASADMHELFSIDAFAVSNRLFITNRLKAKKISADILDGKMLHICCPATQIPSSAGFSVSEVLAQKVIWTDSPSNADVIISCQMPDPDSEALVLVPQNSIWIGIGCRKGIGEDVIRDSLTDFLGKYSFHEEAIAGLASADIKKEEPGILKVCELYQLPFRTYTAAQLMSLEGTFESSEFVHMHAGADNVCERAALIAAAEDAGEENRSEENERHESGDFSHHGGMAFAISVISQQRYQGVTLAAAFVSRRMKL